MVWWWLGEDPPWAQLCCGSQGTAGACPCPCSHLAFPGHPMDPLPPPDHPCPSLPPAGSHLHSRYLKALRSSLEMLKHFGELIIFASTSWPGPFATFSLSSADPPQSQWGAHLPGVWKNTQSPTPSATSCFPEHTSPLSPFLVIHSGKSCQLHPPGAGQDSAQELGIPQENPWL